MDIRVSRAVRGALLAALLIVASATSQPVTRRATNIATLAAYPAFFHMRPVLTVGTLVLENTGELRLKNDDGTLRVLFKGNVPNGLAEVRGEFWDVGRMNADDPRVTSLDLRNTFQIDPNAPWPKPGQVTTIVASAIAETTAPGTPTLRSLVLYPSRYLDQPVTTTGQFAGRNLLGDLPDAPGRSRYDFVIRSADAAIWVTNIRPRGRDFELSLDSRIDTGRWVEVSGTLKQARGLQWIEADQNSLKLTKPPAASTAPDEDRAPVALPPPPEVIFSTPTQDEIDVTLMSSVRIQFSRDLDPGTIKGRVKVSYVTADTTARGELDTPGLQFTTQYQSANRVLELKFASPLERFRTVHVDLTEGILGTDRQAVAPWRLTFITGG